MAVRPKKKIRLHKNPKFFGLIKIYRTYYVEPKSATPQKHRYATSFLFFKKNYMLLVYIFYIFDLLKSWKYIGFSKNSLALNLFRYYAIFSLNSMPRFLTKFRNVLSTEINNIIIFSRPAKQLFLMFYKNKPIFIFTGGLMRIVMNEKKKSSKKLYKVATSLIKLCAILFSKKNFFSLGFIKLINVGNLRTKILNKLYNVKKYAKIQYVIIKFRINFTAQKLETRRAIKKYVKKRFKIR